MRPLSRTSAVDGPPTTSTNTGAIVSSLLARHPGPKDQDIIDLVRPDPDLVQTREPIFSPTNPDFHNMMQTPESHFEIKPRRDPTDALPSEYNPPLPSGSYGSTDSNSAYHPPGCIPTPVLIATKIAENQGGGTTNITPSSLLRRLSSECEKPASYSGDPTVKQGPPTSAKPSRLPANISLVHGSKEYQSQSLPNVNINERRAQMLANLVGTAHPLLQEDPQQTLEQTARNTPARSISFKDPSPDKSRMEALSKLGLNRGRALSGGMSLLVPPDNGSLNPPTNLDASAIAVETHVPPTTDTSSKVQEANVSLPHHSQIQVERKPEIVRRDSVDSHENKSLEPFPPPPPVSEIRNYPPPPSEIKAPSEMSNYPPPPVEIKAPSGVSNYPPPPVEIKAPSGVSNYPPPPLEIKAHSGMSNYAPPPVETKAPVSPPLEVTTPEFNRYGGKSIMINPTVTPRSEPSISPTSPEPKGLPPALTNPSEFNNYGGKTKVINTAPVPMPRSDLPDILSSHIDKTRSLPSKPEFSPTELNSYGGKSRIINPSVGINGPPEITARSVKVPAPTPAPKPPRHSYHGIGTPHKPAQRSSMFRPQSITVQFSGKGATDESRRDALRKLGLLKDS
ncbi:proline and serine-rich protein 2 [Xyrichtys novacula]|nr:proline and serine-rich protein 2 [Xyrichtys novacula]